MVKVREYNLGLDSSSIDIDAWLYRLKRNYGYIDLSRLNKALKIINKLNISRKTYEGDSRSKDELSYLNIGLELVNILASLHLDINSLIAAVFYYPMKDNVLALDSILDEFNESIIRLIVNVHGMAAISECYQPKAMIEKYNYTDQSTKVRKMLISIIDDPRVALIKLAERCCIMRELKFYPENIREKIANEVFEIYAPLAHRLSIGCIKWELEDLSFRYIKPTEYKEIASLLDGKRLTREQYIKNVITKLEECLSNANIESEVTGRVKHIYSIWRKMRKKNTSFENLYDIRAVRITVKTVRDCYTALSIVHDLWQYIADEFDDYIATPKENGYRSLHTAVFGPENKTVEIQIRTDAMHEEAELGVCSHWKYKEIDYDITDNTEKKISWLRQVMKWNEEISVIDNTVESKKSRIDVDRTYVFTKNADVIDLVRGATPIDFAYKIHSEVGHKCCGAKIFGQIVPLNYVLQTGDKVEILTSENSKPSRDWLNYKLNYVATAKARTKIVAWFNQQAKINHIDLGKKIIEKELKKRNNQNIDLKPVAKKIGFNQVNQLYSAIASGSLKLNYFLQTLRNITQAKNLELQQQINKDYTKIRSICNSDIDISGVNNLLTHLAGCCKPIPGDPIIGYITKGRGISIHKKDCGTIYYLNKNNSDRFISVSWVNGNSQFYPADILIESINRPKLLHDITQVFANNKANVVKLKYKNKNSCGLRVKMQLTIEIPGNVVLDKLLSQIKQIPNITLADRIVNQSVESRNSSNSTCT